jgi:hypothetical protein
MSSNGIRHETEVTVSATPEEVWQAITDPAMTRGYYYGTDILSDWTVGATWTSRSGDVLAGLKALVETGKPLAAAATPRTDVPRRVDRGGRGQRRAINRDMGSHARRGLHARASDPRRHGRGHSALHRGWLGAHPGGPKGAGGDRKATRRRRDHVAALSRAIAGRRYTLNRRRYGKDARGAAAAAAIIPPVIAPMMPIEPTSLPAR